MKIRKLLLSASVFIISVLAYAQAACAAPVQMADGGLFDAQYYAESNPDVVSVFGTDPNYLYLHYVVCGKAEGRLPYAQGTAAVIPAAGNSLAQTRINIFGALVGHGEICENGKIIAQSPGYMQIETPEYILTAEGSGINFYRDESVLFDANAYAMLNPDLAAVYGTDKAALWNEYKTEGALQGRQVMGTTLNANAKLLIIQVAQAITAPNMTTEQKIRAVHDWMANYAVYDESFAQASQTIEGFMYNRTAVCAGYAKTFEYFMAVLGIPCETIRGIADGEDHAWNRVAVNGVWLYVDVTWDDPVYTLNGVRRDKVLHTYYLITEAKMNADHFPVSYHDFY